MKRFYMEVAILSDLSNGIQSCFLSSKSSIKIMNNVAKLLQQFGKPGIEATINEILNNTDLLIQIAATSYLHKNGFYKIVLCNHQNYNIRFHIWMPGVAAKETLHNHRWYIASTIIHGNLHSEIWEDSASIYAQSYDEYLYTGKHVDPTPMGKARVELIKNCRHKAGDAYILKPYVLHRIITHQQELTATLICRSACGNNWSRNIIVNNLVPNVRPNFLQPNELSQILKKYLLLTTTEKSQHYANQYFLQ
jgi:hypothetical protein